MADSAIVITSLSVSAGVKQNIARWTATLGSCLPYLGLDKFEVWAAGSNDRTAAAKVGETSDVSFTHDALAIGVPLYYWVRARDASGNVSDFYPLSSTGGIGATPTSTGANSVGGSELQTNSVSNSKIQAGAVTADKITVNSLDALSATLGNVQINGSLIIGSTVITEKLAASAVTTTVVTGQDDFGVSTRTNPTNYGTIKSAGITVTNGGSVLVRFTCGQDVPISDSADFGTWTATLTRDGIGLTARATPYDDNFCQYFILEAADTPGDGFHTYGVSLTVTPNGGRASFNLKSMQLVLQQFKR